MLLIAALAAQAASPPPVRVQATATVRIERPVAARSDQWNQVPPSHKREVIVRDEEGRRLLLRIIEEE